MVGHDFPPRRVETGFASTVTECAPTAWFDDQGIHLFFIAGDMTQRMPYELFRMDGPTVDSLGWPVRVCKAEWGCGWNDRIVTGETANLLHIRSRHMNMDLELPGAFLGRISYHADKPHRLLIGAQWQLESELMTIEYDLLTESQSVLLCDGGPAYKCAIFQDTILYVKRGRHGTRAIHQAKTFHRRAFSGIKKRRPGSVPTMNTRNVAECACFGTVDLGPEVRQSCLECVEKHVGACYVLLAEERDGYAHRLRAIGHMHEAEDESQAWPSLHDTIRRARKAYQQKGIMPDWGNLQEWIGIERKKIESNQEERQGHKDHGEND